MKKLKQQNWLQQNWPLKQRALFIALLLSITASLLVGLPITRASVEQLELQSVQLSNTLSRQVSIQASDAIFSQDLLSLNVILDTLVKDPLIRYGAVYNLKNEIIAEQGTADTLQGRPLSIRYQNEVIGLLEIRLDRSKLEQSISRLYGLWFILSSLLCIIGSLTGWLAGRYLGNKLQLTQAQIEQLGDTSSQISIHKLGELHPLSLALLQHQQQLLGNAAVSKALTQFMTIPNHNNASSDEHPQNDNVESHAAVLFINLINLPQVQEQLPASELAQLLNEYYELIHQAAALYNGHVDRYMGKGVMVLFGLPNEDAKDCFHGVCMALLLEGLLKDFNQQRTTRNLPSIDFQLGIHAGQVLSCEQDNQSKMIMCDTLHTASRVARHAEANRLLISEDVINHGQLAGQLILNKYQDIKSQNSEHLLQTFWAQSLTPNYQALIDRQVQHIRTSQVSAKT